MFDIYAIRISFPVLALVIAAAFLAFAPMAHGQGQGQNTRSAEDLVKVQVLMDRSSVASGDTAYIAVVFDVEQPWHIYWKNPGAGAAAPFIEVTGPDSVEIGDILWPRPKKIGSQVGDMYCYENRAVLFVPVRPVSSSTRPSAVMLEVLVDYAVCDDRICLMGDQRATTQIMVTGPSSGTPVQPSVLPTRGQDDEAKERLRAEVRKHFERLPVQLTHDATHNEKHKAVVKLDGSTLTVTVPAHDQRELTYFPGGIDGIRFEDVRTTIDAEENVAHLTAEVKIDRNNIYDPNPKITGLLALGSETTGPSYEFTLPMPGDS